MPWNLEGAYPNKRQNDYFSDFSNPQFLIFHI